MSKEAMKLALEALTKNSDRVTEIRAKDQAITALREALAQPEQEPLEYWNAVEGWVKIDEVREHFDSVGCGTIYKTPGDGRVPLTAAQRTWVGLNEDQRQQVRDICDAAIPAHVFYAIEAKLKELNQ